MPMDAVSEKRQTNSTTGKALNFLKNVLRVGNQKRLRALKVSKVHQHSLNSIQELKELERRRLLPRKLKFQLTNGKRAEELRD